MDFLAEDHTCGQTLLKLVARGNATIAELLRLKDNIPTVFSNPNRIEQKKYGELATLDFNYFHAKFAEQFEAKLKADEALQGADEDLKTTYLPIITRFYRLFQSIHRYLLDLIRFVKELDDGTYIHMSLEAALLDEDAQQLLCESLYLYGVMLLLADLHIDGVVRERMLVAYYRYSGQDYCRTDSNLDDICQLLRSTGYCANKRPQGYPENYLNRIKLPEHFIRLVLGRLRSDDLYNALKRYPDPDHRSCALAEQASMIYVVLYFDPETLKNATATMRELTDKFFSDNWVITFYMGTVVNLAEWWLPYKAAKASLDNTLQQGHVRMLAIKRAESFKALLSETSNLLMQEATVPEYILDNMVKFLNCVRDCNVTLRWIILHSNELTPLSEMIKKCRQSRELVIDSLGSSASSRSALFTLLLNTSQFEYRLRSLYKNQLKSSATNFQHHRDQLCDRLRHLATFHHEPAISNHSKLREWFVSLQQQAEGLSIEDKSVSSRIAAQLIEALKEAMDLEQFSVNWSMKQNMEESIKHLYQIIRTAGLKEDVLITLQIIGDISYCWDIVDSMFTEEMQKGLKQDPFLVGKLRTTFLKLCSALERPILRISQAKSPDLVSVSQYYSTELVSYVRKVLHIIPHSMFQLLSRIIQIQTEDLQELPTRLDKDKLKDLAQLDQRYEVAKLTHTISIFTEGLLAMKSTLVGVIQVDPKQLLENGIRKEIVRQVTQAFHDTLTFSVKPRPGELYQRLSTLSKIMHGFQTSFEYIQDYVQLNGLKIWQEELCRIIGFHVEQESNMFLKQKSDLFQSRSIPIPLLPSSDPSCLTFMGRLANQIIQLTSPKITVFIPTRQAWYDTRTLEEITSLGKLFPQLDKAVGSSGMSGLDRLLGFKAVTELQRLVHTIDKNLLTDKFWLEMLDNFYDSLNPVDNIVASPHRFYHQQHLSRSSRPLSTLLDHIQALGQLQLIRRQLAYQLALSASFDAKLLHSSLKALNSAVISNIKQKKWTVASDKAPSDNRLLYELTNYLNWAGLSDPDHQVYIMGYNPSPRLPELLFLAVITNLSKMTVSQTVGGLLSKRMQDTSGHVDAHVFLLGLSSLLQQYPEHILKSLLGYLAQYIRSYLFDSTNSSNKTLAVPASGEVLNGIWFHEMLCWEKRVDPSERLPEPVLHLLPITS